MLNGLFLGIRDTIPLMQTYQIMLPIRHLKYVIVFTNNCTKLTHVWDIQIELTGSMVGNGSEIDEVFESPSHSFCELDDPVDGPDGSGG
jgi:hypothetical protein